MRISVTLLSSYLYCPRKIFLERVLGMYEPPKDALIKGTVKHLAFEMINDSEERIVKSVKNKEILSEIGNIYEKEYIKILRQAVLKNKKELEKFDVNLKDFFNKTKPIFINLSQSRAFNVLSFSEKHNVFGDELWEKLTPKIQSELNIFSPGLELSGIIDQLEIYEHGYVPIELKSGKAPREDAWHNHKIQLGAYSLLIEEKFKTNIKEGFIHYIDSDSRRHVPMNVFLKDEVIELRDKVKKLLSEKELPSHCHNQNKCKVCGLYDNCYNERVMKKAMEKLG